MEITRVGWWYRGNVGSIDVTNQTSAGGAVAWAYHASDIIHETWGADTNVIIYLSITGVDRPVAFEYPGSSAGRPNARGLASKGWRFISAIVHETTIDRNEVRDWWNNNPLPALGENCINESFYRNFERPEPSNPGSFMLDLMLADHPLNDDDEVGDMLFGDAVSDEDRRSLSPDASVYLDQYDVDQEALDELFQDNPHYPLNAPDENSGPVIMETPGTVVSTEDVPPVPALPADHPLNDAGGLSSPAYKIIHSSNQVVVDRDLLPINTYNFGIVVPDDNEYLSNLIGKPVISENGEQIGCVDEVIACPSSRRHFSVKFSLWSHQSFNWLNYEAQPGTVGIMIIAKPAVPAISESLAPVYKITSPSGVVSYLATRVEHYSDRLTMGLFFIPPGNDLTEEIVYRARGWATWMFDKPLRHLETLPLAPSVELRSSLVDIVSDIVNKNHTYMREYRGASIFPSLPPWLRDLPRGRYDVEVHID